MITYKNISFSAKTFYGVRFEPGEIKSVPGYINSPSMVRIKVPKQPAVSESIVSKRGRKKSTEASKVEVAEQEVKITENISEEEISDGN